MVFPLSPALSRWERALCFPALWEGIKGRALLFQM